MQIGAESNLNSPTPRVRTIRQLPFRPSALSTVVRRRVFTSGHEIPSCDRNACASTCCPAHSFEIRLATIYCCYVRTHLFAEKRDVGGREANNVVIREVNTPGTQGDGVRPRPSVCVMAIGDCSGHSFLVVIEMPALQPAHSFETSACYNLMLSGTHLFV